MLYFIVKIKFLQMYIIKIQILIIKFHMTVFIQNLARKTVELRLNDLRILLKNNKYPDHIITNALYNAKPQGPSLKPKNNFNDKSFVTSFHKDTDKNIMKNIKGKTESTLSDYIKGIFKESNIFLLQSQPKNLVRLLSNSSISRNMSLTT